VYLADGLVLDIVSMGDVGIGVHCDLVWKLQKVKHVLGWKENLISMGQLDEQSMILAFTVVSEKLAREPGFWLVDTIYEYKY